MRFHEITEREADRQRNRGTETDRERDRRPEDRHTCDGIILRVTAYSGDLLSPSVTKIGYTGFWLVSEINRRKLVTSSENSERVTSSVRSNSISYGHILNV